SSPWTWVWTRARRRARCSRTCWRASRNSSALIGQRTAEALRAKQAAGVRLGRPPMVPEPVRARIIHARQSGATYAAIAEALNRDCVPTAHGAARWQPSTVAWACAPDRQADSARVRAAAPDYAGIHTPDERGRGHAIAVSSARARSHRPRS